MDSTCSIALPVVVEETARLSRLVGRLAALLTAEQLRTALSWTALAPEERALLEQHLRWAEAARHGLVDGGDK